MSADTPSSLVHEGWNHLRLQRPLAAWASWQRALRTAPDDPAARQALAALVAAVELPVSARSVYRFQAPVDEARRRRWDERLRGQGQGLDDIEGAVQAFADLTAADPSDEAAWHNTALCLAWLGRNAEAVDALDRFVALRAGVDHDRAAEAWTLAELLRLGAGAESLADDLRYVWTIDRPDVGEALDALFERWPNLRPVSMPTDPLTGGKALDDGRVLEWLDRPVDGGPDISVPPRPDQVARVLAAVIGTPHALRLSTPDPSGLDSLADPSMAVLARALQSARREAIPLPLAWADAALGTFRFPSGLDPTALPGLTRGVVERYFEALWIHRPRHGLGGRSPLEASRAAAIGDAVMRAKLEAVVRFREQLGTRPSHALLYQGYPFDRLRCRLGLIGPESTAAVDPDDLTCRSEAELDALDPSVLDGERLADAFTAAATFGDDARTARFAAELARRRPPSLARLDIEAVVAPLVREALQDGDPELALERLDRAQELARDAGLRRTFATWSAEVLARSGRPNAALEAYQSILADADIDAAVAAAAALDSAETLLDNGATGPAVTLLREARTRARAAGDIASVAKAEALLGELGH
jgi:tetratricopeptide (TPR) repeat protein